MRAPGFGVEMPLDEVVRRGDVARTFAGDQRHGQGDQPSHYQQAPAGSQPRSAATSGSRAAKSAPLTGARPFRARRLRVGAACRPVPAIGADAPAGPIRHRAAGRNCAGFVRSCAVSGSPRSGAGGSALAPHRGACGRAQGRRRVEQGQAARGGRSWSPSPRAPGGRKRARAAAGQCRSCGSPSASGSPAFSHDSTSRSVCRNTSCSREQHQCRSAGRSCAHTTHSPAACRSRRSFGRLDHRASLVRSHASAARLRFLASNTRRRASALAASRHAAWRTDSPSPSGSIPADVARPPADRRRKVALRVAKDCREKWRPPLLRAPSRSIERQGGGLSVGYGGSAAAHRWQLPAPRRAPRGARRPATASAKAAPRQRRLPCAQAAFQIILHDATGGAVAGARSSGQPVRRAGRVEQQLRAARITPLNHGPGGAGRSPSVAPGTMGSRGKRHRAKVRVVLEVDSYHAVVVPAIHAPEDFPAERRPPVGRATHRRCFAAHRAATSGGAARANESSGPTVPSTRRRIPSAHSAGSSSPSSRRRRAAFSGGIASTRAATLAGTHPCEPSGRSGGSLIHTASSVFVTSGWPAFFGAVPILIEAAGGIQGCTATTAPRRRSPVVWSRSAGV